MYLDELDSLINAVEWYLMSFDLKFWFDDDLVFIRRCHPYGAWQDLYFARDSDTIYGEIHIAGAGGGFSTSGNLTAVAQYELLATDTGGIGRMEGQIIEITYIDMIDDLQHIFNTEMVAAHGYTACGRLTSNGLNRRYRLLQTGSDGGDDVNMSIKYREGDDDTAHYNTEGTDSALITCHSNFISL